MTFSGLPFRGALGVYLGAFWGALGSPWERPGGPLGALGESLGALWDALGRPWEPLGSSLAPFGVPWGAFLERFRWGCTISTDLWCIFVYFLHVCGVLRRFCLKMVCVCVCVCVCVFLVTCCKLSAHVWGHGCEQFCANLGEFGRKFDCVSPCLDECGRF